MNKITEFCRQLRNNPTPAEKILWEEIRRRNINGEKFLRQFPIFVVVGLGRKAFYIADFYCAKYKLVIDVDGPIHLLKKDYDENRDAVMKELGVSVLRFTNDEVINDIQSVICEIERYVLANWDSTVPKPENRRGWEGHNLGRQLKTAQNQIMNY